MTDITTKNLDDAKNARIFTFLDGSRRSVVVLKSVAIGKGEYLPGWKWSQHVGAQTGKSSMAHIGYILSGKMIVQGTDEPEIMVGPGDAFEMGPGHDAWVIGDKPCTALDFEILT